jgi:hypothetical protein
MKALRFPESSVLTRTTRRNIPEDGNLHSHRCENITSYLQNVLNLHQTSNRFATMPITTGSIAQAYKKSESAINVLNEDQFPERIWIYYRRASGQSNFERWLRELRLRDRTGRADY